MSLLNPFFCCSISSIGIVLKSLIGYHLKKTPESDIFLVFISIFGLKIKFLDNAYACLIVQFAVVFPA